MADNIHISYQEVPRFKAGSKDSIDYLDEHGFLVVRNALSEPQAAEALSMLWDYLG